MNPAPTYQTAAARQEPAAGVPQGALSQTATVSVLATMLVGGLFLPRFAVPMGERELSLTLVVTVVCIVLLVMMGNLRVSVPRLIFYVITAACLIMAAMLGKGLRVSIGSLMLLLTLYACYVFVLPADDRLYLRVLGVFRTLALVMAVCGIVQFLAQFAIPGKVLFTFEPHLPRSILSLGWNFSILVPGSFSLYKSNGFFMVEPSTFSQLMAIAIIVELLYFRLSMRLAILVLALGLAFAGTGLLLFAVFAPLLLLRRGHPWPLLAAAAGCLVLAVFAEELKLTLLFRRVQEFGADNSSAFARFLSPFYLFEDFVFPRAQTLFFGLGPGAIDKFFKTLRYEVHDPTWGKLFFEYGLVGFISLMLFVAYCFFGNARAPWLAVAMYLQYLMLGGNLLDARFHPVVLVLVIFQNVPRPRAMPGRRGMVPTAAWAGGGAPDGAARWPARIGPIGRSRLP